MYMKDTLIAYILHILLQGCDTFYFRTSATWAASCFHAIWTSYVKEGNEVWERKKTGRYHPDQMKIPSLNDTNYERTNMFPHSDFVSPVVGSLTCLRRTLKHLKITEFFRKDITMTRERHKDWYISLEKNTKINNHLGC